MSWIPNLGGVPGRCFAATLRIRVSATGLFTYPDVVAACDDLQFDAMDANALLDPMVIVEVLSKSTELYNRVEKFSHYPKDRLPDRLHFWSLRPSHTWNTFVKQPDSHWLLFDAEGLEGKIVLASIGCELALSEVYDKVIFGTRKSNLDWNLRCGQLDSWEHRSTHVQANYSPDPVGPPRGVARARPRARRKGGRRPMPVEASRSTRRRTWRRARSTASPCSRAGLWAASRWQTGCWTPPPTTQSRPARRSAPPK